MIYIIITTSIFNINGGANKDLTHRQRRYVDSISNLLQLIQNDVSIKPIIVENNGLSNTYLDRLNCEVCYTNNNQFRYPHKGMHELLDIKDVIKQYNIQDEDVIIKLTGRYKVLDLSFINLVKKNMDTHDAFLKFFRVSEKIYMFNDCVLGLFSIKCKFLKDFKYKCVTSPEVEFAEYVRESIDKDKLMEVQQLNLECCFADDLHILVV